MLLPDLTDSTNTVRHLVVGAGKDSQLWQQLTHVLGNGTGNTGGIWPLRS